jgi:hypothetical protein
VAKRKTKRHKATGCLWLESRNKKMCDDGRRGWGNTVVCFSKADDVTNTIVPFESRREEDVWQTLLYFFESKRMWQILLHFSKADANTFDDQGDPTIVLAAFNTLSTGNQRRRRS